VKYDSSWVHPATPGLPIAVCAAGNECGSRAPHRFVECTMINGLCVTCAQKRGITAMDESGPPSNEQLVLGGPWGA
jgi:hypothetical protein